MKGFEENMKSTALVADIQKASLHDGPGFRTTVFFKGCPLSCKWCHNPECINPKEQMLFYPEKCIGCGKCADGCFSGARVKCGKEITEDELLSEILSDKAYYGENGGVTFSGGEPLLQRDFLRSFIPLCRENGVKCAVETSLIFFDGEIFSEMQVVMADFKVWTSDVHREYTGVGNEKIIENFKRLDLLGVPIIARTPIIPGVPQEIEKISAFLKGLKNVKKYELLPYHPLGESKRAALGLSPSGFEVPDNALMKEMKDKYAFDLR